MDGSGWMEPIQHVDDDGDDDEDEVIHDHDHGGDGEWRKDDPATAYDGDEHMDDTGRWD